MEASNKEVERYRNGETDYGSKGFGKASEEEIYISMDEAVELDLTYRRCSGCGHEVVAQRDGAITCPECGYDLTPIASAGSINTRPAPDTIHLSTLEW